MTMKKKEIRNLEKQELKEKRQKRTGNIFVKDYLEKRTTKKF
jgi:hypothetical protein